MAVTTALEPLCLTASFYRFLLLRNAEIFVWVSWRPASYGLRGSRGFVVCVVAPVALLCASLWLWCNCLKVELFTRLCSCRLQFPSFKALWLQGGIGHPPSRHELEDM